MLTEEQLRSRLLNNARQGALVRNWCQHPAYKLFETALKEELEDKKNLWLRGTEAEAKAARDEAKGLYRALQILGTFMKAGAVAKQTLVKERENDLGTPE